MSKKCMEFLYNSFLYSYTACEQLYSTYTDNEINDELQKYRHYVLENSKDIRLEVKGENDKLNACFESWDRLPDEKLYRQMVLYMDQVVISDPVFKLTETHSAFSNVSAELLGFPKQETINRKEIVDSINYIRSIVRLIEAGFVVLLPLTFMHEEPKEIPILYSPTAFSDIIPKEILEYLRSIAKVSILERTGMGLRVLPDIPGLIGPSILVDFIDEDKLSGSLYQYMDTKILEFNENTGKATFAFRPADSITEEQFAAWANQSINQAANKHFNAIYKEIVFSKECNCMYLTQSTIVSNVLNRTIKAPSMEAKLATMALDIDLPITSHIPLEELLIIRKDYGTAFSNFRSDLNKKLLSLDLYTDADSLKRQIESISYELNNLQVQEVEKEYRKIIRTLKLDTLALAGSLIATFTTGGITAVGAAGAFLKGISDIGKYFTEVHENNGYFLWRVSKKDKKLTI